MTSGAVHRGSLGRATRETERHARLGSPQLVPAEAQAGRLHFVA